MRIVGINIPDDKNIEIALTYIYGIGRTSAGEILEKTGIDKVKKAENLTPEEITKIKNEIEERYKIGGELRQSIRQSINRLKTIKSYRGIRHARKLPARGQRTRRNSRTVRGNVRMTAGSGRKKLTLK